MELNLSKGKRTYTQVRAKLKILELQDWTGEEGLSRYYIKKSCSTLKLQNIRREEGKLMHQILTKPKYLPDVIIINTCKGFFIYKVCCINAYFFKYLFLEIRSCIYPWGIINQWNFRVGREFRDHLIHPSCFAEKEIRKQRCFQWFVQGHRAS